MATKITEEQLVALARTTERRAFYLHFSLYVVVNLILILVWRFTGPGFPWFLYPLGIWGLVVVVHYLFAFVSSRRTGRTVERLKRRIAKRMEKEARRAEEPGDPDR